MVSVEIKTKQKLINAAKKMFAAKGFKETTVKELVEEAGVNISLVSYHFGNKEGLYKCCIGHAAFDRLIVTEKILKTPKTVEEFKLRLEMYIQEMMSFYVTEPEITAIIHREFEINSAFLEEVFENAFLKTFLILQTYIQSAQDKDLISKSCDSKIFTSMFFGYLIHLARMDHLTNKYFKLTIKDKMYQEKIVSQMMSIFWDGICVKGQVNEK